MTSQSIHPAEQQRLALQAAAQWYARLCSGNASEADEQALQVWLETSELNLWAWGRVDQLQKRLQGIPGKLALTTLERTDHHFRLSRRSVLKGFVLMLGTGALGWSGQRQGIFEPLLADQYTATGEIETIILADGSRLTLNTASAVDIQFSRAERRVVLRQGEIMVQTAKDDMRDEQTSRPFIVQTEFGDVRALGTRFSVRRQDKVLVDVYQHSVEVTIKNGKQQHCSAGQALNFDAHTISSPTPVRRSDAWTREMLIVENMRLAEFAAELSRYRSGILRCDPAVAHYRISGAFKTSDTDQALRAIEKSFPVKVNYRSKYWVSITS